MNILIAPDSFKESLTANKVARSIAHGINKINPNHNIEEIPISDGGEGSIEFLKKKEIQALLLHMVLDYQLVMQLKMDVRK